LTDLNASNVTPAPVRPPLPDRVLLLRIGDERLAIESRHVRGVVPVTELTPVPRAPAHVKGIFHHLGRIVPLVDLRPALGLPLRPQPQAEALALLLEVPPWFVAADVDEVVGFEVSEPRPETRASAPGSEEIRSLAKGTVGRDGRDYTLLDAWRLMDTIRVG
jgi:purine-binding chemotaxis protein CheW